MSSQFGDSHEFIAFLEEDLMLSEQQDAMDISMIQPRTQDSTSKMDATMSLADVTIVTAAGTDADLDDLPFPSQIPVSDAIDADIDLDEDLECDDDFEFELDMTLTQMDRDTDRATEVIQFAGFTTGKGRALSPPSEESMKRAKQMIGQEEDENDFFLKENVPVDTAPAFFGFSTGKGKALPPPSKAAMEKAQMLINEAEPPKAIEAPIAIGFSTGKGKALPPPSKEALEKAQKLISVDEPPATSFTVGFSTGKGKALPPPSNEALAKAQNLISEVEQPTAAFTKGKGKSLPPPSKEALEKAASLLQADAPKEFPAFSTGKGKTLPPPSKEAMQRAQSLMNQENSAPVQPASSVQPSITSVMSKRRNWKQPRQTAVIQSKPTEASKRASIISLFDLKAAQPRVKLAEYFAPSLPSSYPSEIYSQYGISQTILEMDSVKAASFRWPHFGPGEARAALLAAGAQASCCSLEWIENHWRWIVWKFAALIRAFPLKYSADNLSPAFVLSQLAYRYEREVNQCQRSALKRCLERDDSASKYMCLAVAQIDRIKGAVELTDGWYSCWTSAFDQPLRELLNKNRIFAGQKLEICGAQLTGEDGIPALEGSRVDCPVKLVISRNSVRRAPWSGKLGLLFHAPVFLKHLSQVHALGGYLPAVKVCILRCYPLAFRDDSCGVVRSEREHFELLERRQNKNNNHFQKGTEDDDPPSFSPIQKIRGCDPLRPELECVVTFWFPIESLPAEGSLVTFTALKTPLKTKRLSWPAEDAAPLLLSATKSTRIVRESSKSTPVKSIQPAHLHSIKAKGDYDLTGLFLGKNSHLLWFSPDFTDSDSNQLEEDLLFCIRLPQLLNHISFSVGERVSWRDAHFLNCDSRAGVLMFNFTERTDFRKTKTTANGNNILFKRFMEKFQSLVK